MTTAERKFHQHEIGRAEEIPGQHGHSADLIELGDGHDHDADMMQGRLFIGVEGGGEYVCRSGGGQTKSP
jgi:hypothetical protein